MGPVLTYLRAELCQCLKVIGCFDKLACPSLLPHKQLKQKNNPYTNAIKTHIVGLFHNPAQQKKAPHLRSTFLNSLNIIALDMPQIFFGLFKPSQKPTVRPEEIAELHCHLTLGVSCWKPDKTVPRSTDSSHLKIGKQIPNPDLRISRLPLPAIFFGGDGYVSFRVPRYTY